MLWHDRLGAFGVVSGQLDWPLESIEIAARLTAWLRLKRAFANPLSQRADRQKSQGCRTPVRLSVGKLSP